MAKFYGAIGYAEDNIEVRPGIWKSGIIERNYYCDVIRNQRRLEKGDQINDDITLNNSISIVSDAYADQHFFAMRYVEWMGAKWKITNVEVQPPRLILTIGGVYNGETN